ncbi:hypothetical protein [Paraburkholderia sp. J8-2]|uniref:hypothetical protein n=1 Tax=Paraburkholderia sp. J8-2 TaxID=2805440 RepID=UPI002AB6D7DC|nr:hypothetical protein [Paraburkholderia sp. J8-2]
MVDEMRIYFRGQQGGARAMLFAGHATLLGMVFLLGLVLLQLGLLLLEAILAGLISPLAVAQVIQLEARGGFVLYAQQTLANDVVFFAIVAGAAAVGAEIYWTVRRARRINPPRIDR